MEQRLLSDAQNASFDTDFHAPKELEAKLSRLKTHFGNRKIQLLDAGGGNGSFSDVVLEAFPYWSSTIIDISDLIVWLYVGRNIVARLTGLSSCMAAIANGRRDVVINTEGTDEVSAMGRAVEVFRQNAIERDALLIKRAETAQRLEQLVGERTKELRETVGTLKEASEVIASSIQYASRIQRSILPESTLVESTLSDYLILWEPRDVVSGDVYWLARWGDGLLIALGDCTGHGVPGAFVTLIANSALERALLDVDPGAVGVLISRMNQLIKSSLKQIERGGESDDGMDLGICYIPADHTRLSFAGAGFSLFSAAPGEDLIETKGNARHRLSASPVRPDLFRNRLAWYRAYSST
jgi:HAMP domain-containing protein